MMAAAECEQQIVDYKGTIEFQVKLDDVEKRTVISPKKNIGHLEWSVISTKMRHKKRKYLTLCLRCERQANNVPVEFKLGAYMDSWVVSQPNSDWPEKDYQYYWKDEHLCFDTIREKQEKTAWYSERRMLDWDVLRKATNDLLDDEGRVHFEAHIEIHDMTNYGRLDKSDQIIVNGQIFSVNKYILAGISPYFRTFFFKDGFKEFLTQNFEIKDPDLDSDLFGKMLDIVISPDIHEPDDTIIEELLAMADKFDINLLKEICEKYLMEESDRSAIFRFRMAEKYGLVGLKSKTLRRLNPQEFCSHFIENVEEFAKLSVPSKRTWDQRMHSLCANYAFSLKRARFEKGERSKPKSRHDKNRSRSRSTYSSRYSTVSSGYSENDQKEHSHRSKSSSSTEPDIDEQPYYGSSPDYLADF